MRRHRLPNFKSKPRPLGEKGFTLIELLIVIAIIGILAAIAIPQFNAYKKRAYDSASKSHLHHIFLACKSYWADNGAAPSCTYAVIVAGGTAYGYTPSAEVIVGAGGPETTWSASAKSVNSPQTFSMDLAGTITP